MGAIRPETLDLIVDMAENFWSDYDSNSDGLLDRSEIKKLLVTEIGEDPATVDATIAEMDYDGNGLIDKGEFIKFFG